MTNGTLFSPDLKVLSEGEIKWANGIWQSSIDLKEICPSDKDIEKFIGECEENIRNPINSKVEWNRETFNFGGKEYGHVWLFASKSNAIIKLALQIQHESNLIIVGYMKISSHKESKRYVKYIGKSQSYNKDKDINISDDICEVRDI